jgi:acylphosphatase
MSEQRLQATVTGRVQGVGYRYFVRDRAQTLELRGYVCNLEGGGVEVVAEGPEEDLHQLVEALQKGPSAAQVKYVHTSWGKPRGEPLRFYIRHSSY